MKKKNPKIWYIPVAPQNEQQVREAERRLEQAYDALFNLLLTDEKEKK